MQRKHSTTKEQQQGKETGEMGVGELRSGRGELSGGMGE